MDTYPAGVAILESDMLIYIRVKGGGNGTFGTECLPTFNGVISAVL
jgi:hypothetical protein